MLSAFTFLFATSMIILVQSQQWTGSFKTNSTCNQVYCCCLSGTIVVTSLSTNAASLSSGINGVCSGYTSISGNISNSSIYSATLALGSTALALTLSSDSTTISAVNPTNASCNAYAYRSAAIKQVENIITITFLAFIGLAKIAF